MNKKILGIIYLIIGLSSLLFALEHMTSVYDDMYTIAHVILGLVASAFVLSATTFYYGIKFLKSDSVKPAVDDS